MKKDENRDRLIKTEKKKLLKILSKIDENLLKIASSLIDNIAFMVVLLNELVQEINKNGVKEEYCNGQNQFGFKESVESQAYNKYMKSYQSLIKILIDLLTKDGINDETTKELKEYFSRPRQ